MDRRVHKREEWGARPPRANLGSVTDPVEMVFIHTSVTAQLTKDATMQEEREAMLLLQGIAFGRGFSDISYSFIVFPSGRVWEGRGWGVEQAATLGYNAKSYSICMGGNTDVFEETRRQKESIVWLINRGQADSRQRIERHVDVRGHREVEPGKTCPGKKFTDQDLQDIQRNVNHDHERRDR